MDYKGSFLRMSWNFWKKNSNYFLILGRFIQFLRNILNFADLLEEWLRQARVSKGILSTRDGG
jgi:hypothetical protein